MSDHTHTPAEDRMLASAYLCVVEGAWLRQDAIAYLCARYPHRPSPETVSTYYSAAKHCFEDIAAGLRIDRKFGYTPQLRSQMVATIAQFVLEGASPAVVGALRTLRKTDPDLVSEALGEPRVPRGAAPKNPPLGLAPGSTVRHKTYGLGTVQGTSDSHVRVDFGDEEGERYFTRSEALWLLAFEGLPPSKDVYFLERSSFQSELVRRIISELAEQAYVIVAPCDAVALPQAPEWADPPLSWKAEAVFAHASIPPVGPWSDVDTSSEDLACMVPSSWNWIVVTQARDVADRVASASGRCLRIDAGAQKLVTWSASAN